MNIKIIEYKGACIFIALLLANIPAAARDAEGDDFLSVDRSSTTQAGNLDRGCLQSIGQDIGYGKFYVRAAGTGDHNPTLATARVFYFFASSDTLKRQDPLKRIFYNDDTPKPTIHYGNDKDLIESFLKLYLGHTADIHSLPKLIPDILLAALYDNRAYLCSIAWGGLSYNEFERKLACGPTGRDELRNLCCDPFIQSDTKGQLRWQGRFVLWNGHVEEVTLDISANHISVAGLKKTELHLQSNFPNMEGDSLPAEVWIVSNEVNWQASRRYSFMLTLAMLGDTKTKYKLGTALMNEHDQNSNAEGIKWLQSAAADGYADAFTLLAQIDEDPRPNRDRETVRKERCCRIMPRN
jgi:hypothetical protein